MVSLRCSLCWLAACLVKHVILTCAFCRSPLPRNLISVEILDPDYLDVGPDFVRFFWKGGAGIVVDVRFSEFWRALDILVSMFAVHSWTGGAVWIILCGV